MRKWAKIYFCKRKYGHLNGTYEEKKSGIKFELLFKSSLRMPLVFESGKISHKEFH